MSFESATQRMGELQALVAPAADARAHDRASAREAAAFANALARARTAPPAMPAPYQPSGGAAYGWPGGGTALPAAYGGPAGSYGAGPGMYGVAPGMYGMPLDPVAGAGFPLPGVTGQRMLMLARGEVGVSESPPGSNDGARIRDYRSATAGAIDTPGPWCAYFVSWLAHGAGAPVGDGGSGFGYVPSLEAWARRRGTWLPPNANVQPGDVVIFRRGGAGVSDHIGIVERVDADGTLHTIEGNSSNQVARRTYAPGASEASGFVRL